MKSNVWFVSRQNYWGVSYGEQLCVEIALGGVNYANPDMLVEKYRDLGEGQEYTDPREAAEAAIKIAQAWRKDSHRRVRIDYGCTLGYTLPFTDSNSARAIKKWAKAEYAKLPKCDECGDLLPEEYYTDEYGDYKFCREYCAEKAAAREAELNAEDEVEV